MDVTVDYVEIPNIKLHMGKLFCVCYLACIVRRCAYMMLCYTCAYDSVHTCMYDVYICIYVCMSRCKFIIILCVISRVYNTGREKKCPAPTIACKICMQKVAYLECD